MGKEILEMLFEQGAFNFKKRLEAGDPEHIRILDEIRIALARTMLKIFGLLEVNDEKLIQELFMRICHNEITIAEAVKCIQRYKNINLN